MKFAEYLFYSWWCDSVFQLGEYVPPDNFIAVPVNGHLYANMLGLLLILHIDYRVVDYYLLVWNSSDIYTISIVIT